MELNVAEKRLSAMSMNVNYFPPTSTINECLRAEEMNDFVKKFVYF